MKDAKSGKIEKTPNGAQFVLGDEEHAILRKRGKVIGGIAEVLIMERGTTTGPWKVTEIERDKQMDKRYKPVPIAVTAECKGHVRAMPAATSFVEKAVKANLKVGDEFLVERGNDYRANGKDCASYTLTLLDPETAPAAAPAAVPDKKLKK